MDTFRAEPAVCAMNNYFLYQSDAARLLFISAHNIHTILYPCFLLISGHLFAANMYDYVFFCDRGTRAVYLRQQGRENRPKQTQAHLAEARQTQPGLLAEARQTQPGLAEARDIASRLRQT